MSKGFSRLEDALEDLILDVPEATDMLSLFIARGVIDDILPPAAVHRIGVDAPEGSQLAVLRTKVDLHLSARHSAERMLRCWGAGEQGVSRA